MVDSSNHTVPESIFSIIKSQTFFSYFQNSTLKRMNSCLRSFSLCSSHLSNCLSSSLKKLGLVFRKVCRFSDCEVPRIAISDFSSTPWPENPTIHRRYNHQTKKKTWFSLRQQIPEESRLDKLCQHQHSNGKNHDGLRTSETADFCHPRRFAPFPVPAR